MKPSELLNRVLPVKIYDIWSGGKHLGSVVADNVDEALRLGKLEFGEARARVAMLKKPNRMFPEHVRD
jgi:hypothetical protein